MSNNNQFDHAVVVLGIGLQFKVAGVKLAFEAAGAYVNLMIMINYFALVF